MGGQAMTRARPSATVARRRVMRLLPGAALWFGALLAILALANVMGASGWHGALAGHDDSQVTAAVAHHDDGETSPPEIDLHKITQDRKSVVSGQGVSVRVDHGGARNTKKTKQK